MSTALTTHDSISKVCRCSAPPWLPQQAFTVTDYLFCRTHTSDHVVHTLCHTRAFPGLVNPATSLLSVRGTRCPLGLPLCRFRSEVVKVHPAPSLKLHVFSFLARSGRPASSRCIPDDELGDVCFGRPIDSAVPDLVSSLRALVGRSQLNQVRRPPKRACLCCSRSLTTTSDDEAGRKGLAFPKKSHAEAAPCTLVPTAAEKTCQICSSHCHREWSGTRHVCAHFATPSRPRGRPRTSNHRHRSHHTSEASIRP